MAKKNIEATATEGNAMEITDKKARVSVKDKARVSVKDKARKHINRLTAKRIVPMVFEEVLTAYAAIGILKYDEVLEMSDSYVATYITEKIDN